MIDKVRSFIEKNGMIEEGDRIVCGISGGADSIALLKILELLREELSLSVFVVHINHGIRKEAAEDAEYVKVICTQMNIPFYLFEENIPELAVMERCSEEEMGRVFRYKCFSEIMEKVKADKLAVAHHMDDQAETVLFHMIRGTDLTGLSGMRPVSGNIIRPLLCLRKQEICDWVTRQGLIWKEDVTNSDDSYSRNRIRNNIIPELEKINTKSVEHMAQLAGRVSAYDEYIKKQALSYIGEDAGGKIRVNRYDLTGQDKILAERVLYELLASVCESKKDITGKHIEDLYELLMKQSGKRINLPYGVTAYNSYEWTYIEKSKATDMSVNIIININKTALDKDITYEVPGEGTIVLRITTSESNKKALLEKSENLQKNYTKYFDCDTIGDTLLIRYPEKEDYIVMDTEGHRKKIGKYFKDAKLPAPLRSTQIVLAAEHEVLWVIGGRRTENHRIMPETERILMIEFREID